MWGTVANVSSIPITLLVASLALALIIIEYNKIDPKLAEEFEQSVHELGRLLKSEGMAYWELFQDPSDIGQYIEIRIADTWTDHIRQHEYVTKNVQVMENRIRELIKDCPQPRISHYIGKSAHHNCKIDR